MLTKGQTQKWTAFRSLDAFRCRGTRAGDLIRPWIAAGPFFRDVSDEVPGRSFFEDHSLDNGVDVFRRYLEEGEACLTGVPMEGEQLTFLGVELPFQVVDGEEPQMNWGRYWRVNHMVAQFLSTRLRIEKGGTG